MSVNGNVARRDMGTVWYRQQRKLREMGANTSSRLSGPRMTTCARG